VTERSRSELGGYKAVFDSAQTAKFPVAERSRSQRVEMKVFGLLSVVEATDNHIYPNYLI